MTPYLSIVMGVGGNVTEDLIQRLVNSATNIGELVKKTKADCEIVIVEWNVPEDNPLEGFTFFRDSGIEMPVRRIHAGHVHATYPNPNKLAYFEMAPKNIGIRRARGEFVLSTNPDDLFSEELFSFFSRKLLQRDRFYRINRSDTRDGKVFRVCRATGCYPPEATPEEIIVPQPGAGPYSPNMLHFNAAGDAMLMAKDDWFKIHGNPEREWNHTVDGETVWLAHTHGLKQVVLPHAMLHPDHERTLNINADGELIAPDWDGARPHCRQNDENWGFAGVEFEETAL